MKLKSNGLSQSYVTGLRAYLKQGRGADLRPALALGSRAVALGLETLDLARMHQEALTTLTLSGGKNRTVKRAEDFFTEALTPIVATHRAARQSRIDLQRLNRTLALRTAALASTNRRLQRGIRRLKSVEAALSQSGKHYARLLRESLQLQKGLRQLTHEVLAAHEDERKKISSELQDEVSQNLLGINVRLLTLKQEARSNTNGLKNEIASTQRLVVESANSVRLAARKFRNP